MKKAKRGERQKKNQKLKRVRKKASYFTEQCRRTAKAKEAKEAARRREHFKAMGFDEDSIDALEGREQ